MKAMMKEYRRECEKKKCENQTMSQKVILEKGETE